MPTKDIEGKTRWDSGHTRFSTCVPKTRVGLVFCALWDKDVIILRRAGPGLGRDMCVILGARVAFDLLFGGNSFLGRSIAGRSAHSASPSRDLPVAGLFVSFSPFSVLGLFVVFEGLYVLWIGGGYVKRVLGYSVVLRTLWKVEILGNRPLGRCWGGPAFLGPPGSKAWTS